MKELPEIHIDWDEIQEAVCQGARCKYLDCSECQISETSALKEYLIERALEEE